MVGSISAACCRFILCGISEKLSVGDGTIFVLKPVTSMDLVDEGR